MLPRLDDVTRVLREGGPVALAGIVPGARAAALAPLLRAGVFPGPVLVVVPHVGEGVELVAGLRVLAPAVRAAAVPGDIANAYLGSEAPLAARRATVELLAALGAGELDVVVAPARTLGFPLPVPEGLAARRVRVREGEELDPGELARRLAEMGYHRVDLVEEPGEFALRGSVLDVHTGGDAGLRIELDDLVVESIRPFDPATQRRSGEPVKEVQALPLDLFPVTDEARARLSDRLKERWPEAASAVRLGTDRRLWWAFLGMVEPSLTLPELGWPVVICDRDEVVGELARWQAVQEREHRARSERHMPLPPPEELIRPPGEVLEALRRPALRLEGLEVFGEDVRWLRRRTHPQEGFARRIPDLVPTLRQRRAEGLAQLLVLGTRREVERFGALLREGGVEPAPFPPGPGAVALVVGDVEHGFVWDGVLAVYGRRDLTAAPRPQRRRAGAIAAFTADLRDLKPGDFVVHVDHGIGRFEGFRTVEVEGRRHEMVVLAYHGGDTLLVPVERADLLQRYASGEAATTPALDRLGTGSWKRRKSRVRKAVREMAAELLRLAAVRRSVGGHRFSPDSPWQREFEDAFVYELTPDQERAVAEIKADMESPRPMDRLLCGDVGYGKTEVAMRAAFKAVLDGKQVAVLAPTTILAEQHLETFKQRMAGFPVEIRMLSRFVPGGEARQVVAGLADGTVDIVIGTHRLLARDIVFRDLGLIIIDEEQRFGVAQKERFKKLRTEVDVLAMSATPIPRTLNMALSGIRDISLIETPPRDRQAVETLVVELGEEVVREAVLHELEREGQVFFVHNRVRSIGAMARWLERVVPEARVVVAHGQMPERQLERAMHRFLEHEADVLLASAIIENGLDIANANTLIVNRADRFGLAQLYQLRGRVGRSDRLAYAYFLVPQAAALSPTARARLAAIQEFADLGAGFRIAARDLEIRGAGNLLGAEQHGFLEAVGYETYSQLLEEAVAELRGEPLPERREVTLRLGLDVQLPESYLPDAALRLSFYKRLAATREEEALAALLEELRDRYGPPPPQVENLALGQRIRLAAQRAAVVEVVRRSTGFTLRLDPAAGPPPGIAEALAGWPGARLSPSGAVSLPAREDQPPGAALLALLDTLARPA